MNQHALVIEDNELNSEVLTNLLARLGIKVINLDNGQDALKLIETVSASIIFIDLELGSNITGYEVFEAIKSQNTLSHVPVVAYSSFINEMGKTRQMGFNGFLSKPLSSEHFPEQFAALMRGDSIWE